MYFKTVSAIFLFNYINLVVKTRSSRSPCDKPYFMDFIVSAAHIIDSEILRFTNIESKESIEEVANDDDDEIIKLLNVSSRLNSIISSKLENNKPELHRIVPSEHNLANLNLSCDTIKFLRTI